MRVRLSAPAAIVLLDWLNSTDLDAVPFAHRGQAQALLDLISALETDTLAPNATPADVRAAMALISRDIGWTHSGGPLPANGDRAVPDDEVAELSRLEQAATPGPWTSMVEEREHWGGSDFTQAPDAPAAPGEDSDIYVSIRVKDEFHPPPPIRTSSHRPGTPSLAGLPRSGDSEAARGLPRWPWF